MSGGVVPAGNCRSCVCEIAVICAIASLRLAVGCREDFDDSDAVERLRLEVLDVVDGRGERALRDADDAVAHVLGERPL